MKLSQGIVLLGAGLVLVPLAKAEETAKIATEKTAPIPPLTPAPYGRVEVRQVALRELDDKGEINRDRTALHARPTLGATFFNERVDSSFTLDYKTATSSAVVSKYTAFNETSWTVLKGKLNDKSPYAIGPYAYTDLTTAAPGSFSTSDIGLSGDLTYEFPVIGGSLAVHGALQLLVELQSKQYNKDNPVPLEDRTAKGGTSLGLVADESGSYQTDQSNPMGIANYGAGVMYHPNAMPKLGVGLDVAIAETWNPIYTLDEDKGQTVKHLDHYSVQAATINSLQLSYAVNDAVTVGAQLRHFVGGVEEFGLNTNRPDETHYAGLSSYSWESRLAVTASLF